MFMKQRPITIDHHQVQLKITEGTKAILIELRNIDDK